MGMVGSAQDLSGVFLLDPATLEMQLGGKQPLSPHYPGVQQVQPAPLQLQLSRKQPCTTP